VLLAALRRGESATLTSGTCNSPAVAGFESFCFVDDDRQSHPVYVADGGGPPVLLLHEISGLTDADLAVATTISKYGYTVLAPLMFGKPGGDGSFAKGLKVCGASQFNCRAGKAGSPHVKWLRQLVADARRRWPAGRGLGVVGMCLTGAFPIPLLRDPSVTAAVLCQPTLPFNLFTRFGWFTDEAALAVSPEDLEYARTRSTAPLLGIRFQGDWRCRPPRFEHLATAFGKRFYRMDLQMKEGGHHSTLGSEHCGDAFVELRAFLNAFLRDRPDAGAVPFPARSRPDSKTEVIVHTTTCGGPHAAHE
jgi:dienelactone hydrolase